MVSLTIPALVLVPMISGIGAFMIRSDASRRILLACAATAHLVLTFASGGARPVLSGWLAIDAAGRLFLGITSTLFLAASFYGIGYLAREKKDETHLHHHDFEEGTFFTNAPEAVLTGCLLFFLSTMTIVCVSNHLGVLWVAVEATTLASAPMIYFHRHRRSLEAAWKYLLICSIGIALALLGNYLLAVATTGTAGSESPLLLDHLILGAPKFQPLWLKAAFIFLLVGYGTKMGLAPLHTWLPDAHSEAPSLVSALLSGALLNCAFLGIFRAQQILSAAGLAAFGQELLLGFGLLSMGLAAVFILGQTDYKRMLAYSSVEHMGILATGIGLGGAAAFGALLHAVNHSLTKGMLFFLAGNILAATRTKSTGEIRGLTRLLPVTGFLWLAGFFAITGSPPFGAFLSEFVILKAALDSGRTGVAIAFLAILSLIFIAMATIVLRMSQGLPDGELATEAPKEPWPAVVPPAMLGALTLILGIYVPAFLARLIEQAARLLGGS
jgi:hydrogenase-4 component F